MFMGRFYGSETMRMRRDAGLPASLPRPNDFEQTFLAIGRFACQEHYAVGRATITRWLEELGKARLIEQRASLVRDRIEQRKAKRLSIREMAINLSHAFPLEDCPDPCIVQAAAQFLRLVRNGGWPVSPSPDGMWWVGTSLRTAQQLLEFAQRKGFVAPSITPDH